MSPSGEKKKFLSSVLEYRTDSKIVDSDLGCKTCLKWKEL